MGENNLKLSIIIPTYNVGPFVEQLLDSILPQITPDVEIIIVDDMSTDDTCLKILNKIEQYKVPVVFKQLDKNLGVSNARNVGMDLSKGVFISFIDGDDFVEPEFVRSILHSIQSKMDYYLIP